MVDCLVLGAGLAGLSAANELVARGRSVLVLEARDRVGGRIESGELAEGQVVDLGGQWISANHLRMLELVDQCGLKLVVPQSGKVTVRLGGRVSQVASEDDLADSLNPFELSDLGEGLARFRSLANRVIRHPDWVSANQSWLSRPVDRWIASNLRTPGGRTWFAKVFTSSFGVEPSELSLSEALHREVSGVDMESLVAVNGGLRQRRVAGGAWQICHSLAEKLGDRVLLSTPVDRVEQAGDGVTVIAGGQRFTARTLINTLPPKLSTVLPHSPALDPWRAESAQGVPSGEVIKAYLAYEKPWWRGQGRSGQMGADTGAVRVSFDTSNTSGPGVLMGFFQGAQATAYASRDEQDRREAFVEAVATAFGEPPSSPLHYLDRDWTAEAYTGGCHGAHFTPGIWRVAGPALAARNGAEFFAGAEYIPRFNGYMEGAALSGQQVARDVHRELG